MEVLAPRHLASRVFVVRCGDGNVRHSGHWTDPARAKHWADNSPCCARNHTVVPVTPALEVA